MMRSGIRSCGIGWITSTIPLEFEALRTSMICFTVRLCTRSCGMIFEVYVVSSINCGTRTPTISSTMCSRIWNFTTNRISSVYDSWHWDVHHHFLDAFRDSFLNQLAFNLFLNPRNGRVHNLFNNASEHEFQSLVYLEMFWNLFLGHQPNRLRDFLHVFHRRHLDNVTCHMCVHEKIARLGPPTNSNSKSGDFLVLPTGIRNISFLTCIVPNISE